MSTQYNIMIGTEQVASKSKKDKAVEAADAMRADHAEAEITVVTDAGTLVHTVRAAGNHSKPWTRTETHDGIEVEVPDGYVVAYTRKRVGAVVARSEGKDGWLILTESGDRFEAENTVDARMITNDLAAQHRTAQEEARVLEAAAKAEAKAAKDAARAEAKAKADAEKAEAKAKRDADKAAKAEAKRLADEAKAAEKERKAQEKAAADAAKAAEKAEAAAEDEAAEELQDA